MHNTDNNTKKYQTLSAVTIIYLFYSSHDAHAKCGLLGDEHLRSQDNRDKMMDPSAIWAKEWFT